MRKEHSKENTHARAHTQNQTLLFGCLQLNSISSGAVRTGKHRHRLLACVHVIYEPVQTLTLNILSVVEQEHDDEITGARKPIQDDGWTRQPASQASARIRHTKQPPNCLTEFIGGGAVAYTHRHAHAHLSYDHHDGDNKYGLVSQPMA